ncbi:MAG: fibro-slime domain-containing protein, partial [Fibrobacterales bacterium]
MIYTVDFLGLRVLLLSLLVTTGALSAQEVIYLYHPWAEEKEPSQIANRDIVPNITCDLVVNNVPMTPVFSEYGDYWYKYENTTGGTFSNCLFDLGAGGKYGRTGIETGSPYEEIAVNSSNIRTTDTTWIRPDFTKYVKTNVGAPIHSVRPPIFVYTNPKQSLLVLEATIRDFSHSHSDFENSTGCPGDRATENMVQDNLDNDRDPIKKWNLCQNNNFNQWFKNTSQSKTTKRNLVLKNNGTVFEKLDNSFFPINDFKTVNGNNNSNNYINSNQPHDSLNFHFCMEIHADFTYERGNNFYFKGDDDVWVFINGQLVVDIGGMHEAIEQTVNFDHLGLNEGDNYPFDFFFCERHTVASNLRIQTNLKLSQGITPPTISDPGPQNINEDESLTLTVTVDDNEQTPDQLSLTVVSDTQGLIADGNITVSGTGADRTISITPEDDQFGGPVTITINVSDGTLTAQTSFEVMVVPVNDAPV